jgi:hypothetical protein
MTEVVVPEMPDESSMARNLRESLLRSKAFVGITIHG